MSSFFNLSSRDGQNVNSTPSDGDVVSLRTRDAKALASLEPEHLEGYIAIRDSALFDAAWYFQNNTDLQQSNDDPVDHYLLCGGMEGRAAGPDFHSAGYYHLNNDVAFAGMNPLLHYILYGRDEQRNIMTVRDFAQRFGGDGTDRRLNWAVSLVAGSTLYDPVWFQEQYKSLASNEKGAFAILVEREPSLILNPGPGFDSNAYLTHNPDVASEGLNPFLHYLELGRAEGRIAFEVSSTSQAHVVSYEPVQENLELIDGDPIRKSVLKALKESPLFDPSWYLTQYNDVGRAGIDPLLHYVDFGAAEGRKPSLYFDPVFYAEQAKDTLKPGENELAHYLLKGRALGLKPMALLDFTPPSRKLTDVSGDKDPLVEVDHVASKPIGWTRYGDIRPSGAKHVLVFGRTTLTFVANIDNRMPSLVPLLAFARLLKADINIVRLRSTTTGLETIPELSQSTPYRSLGPELRVGIAALADIWSPADGMLRIRLGKPPEDVSTDKKPVVLRAFQADLADPSCVRLVGEGLVSHDPSFVDLILDNPFAPVLLIVTTPEGVCLDLGLLPFPTLVRGGVHAGELLALGEQATTLDTFCAMSDGLVRECLAWNNDNPQKESVASIGIRLDDALGTERIFGVSLREWLLTLFGITVSAQDSEGVASDVTEGMESGTKDGRAYLLERLNEQHGLRQSLVARSKTRSNGARLVLPADAVPTLSVLVSRRLQPVESGKSLVGPYIIADNATARAKWLVSLPGRPGNLASLQPAANGLSYPVLLAEADREADGFFGRLPIPAAVRFPVATTKNDAVQMMPLAPDAPGSILRSPLPTAAVSGQVTVILLNAEKPVAKKAVEALARQSGLHVFDVIAIPAGETLPCRAELRDLFNGRFLVLPSTGFRAKDLRVAAERASGDSILILNSASILHDSRTLATLATLLAGDGVASASCGCLREEKVRSRVIVNTESAGFFPGGLSLFTVPQFTFFQPNVFDALPGATYPVIASDFHCTLVRRELLLQHNTSVDGDQSDTRIALRFGLWALKEGWCHLCTTGVRFSSIGAKSLEQDIDPIGSNFIESGRWEDILERTTLLRELR